MVSNDAIFARFNKIEAAKASFASEARKVELALVDDAQALADKLTEYTTQERELSQRFDQLVELQRQFEAEATSVYEAYDTFRSETLGAYAEAELLTSRLEEAADVLGIEPDELEQYDALTSAMSAFEEVADSAATILDDDVFSFLG
jgi:uncharacterized protein (DUF3084 family)